MEGNRARLYDAATGWVNAGGNATLATDSFKDDLAVVCHVVWSDTSTAPIP
jgi:hypothetical protein